MALPVISDGDDDVFGDAGLGGRQSVSYVL
jgi:hypothetical protein